MSAVALSRRGAASAKDRSKPPLPLLARPARQCRFEGDARGDFGTAPGRRADRRLSVGTKLAAEQLVVLAGARLGQLMPRGMLEKTWISAAS